MKTFLADIFPRLINYSEKLDNLTLLMNQHWVIIDDVTKNKNIYIFRDKQELLISINGKAEKAKWDYLGNNALLIEKKDDSYLFKLGFFDINVLALKIDDGNDKYAVLVNENKYDGELNTIENVVRFLETKYLDPSNMIRITGGEIKEIPKDDEANDEDVTPILILFTVVVCIVCITIFLFNLLKNHS